MLSLKRVQLLKFPRPFLPKTEENLKKDMADALLLRMAGPIPNEAGDSPAVFLAKKNPPANIVYRRVTPLFFVVSSFRGDKIWYNRCNFVNRSVICLLIDYPANEKRRWDGVITRISNTLASR